VTRERDTDALVERVVDATRERDMESEDWEKAVAINGLLATGSESAVDAATDLVDRSIETQTSDGQFSYGSLDYKSWVERTELSRFKGISDPAAIGHAVLDMYGRTGDERYLAAARKQYEFLQDIPRTADGGIPHHRGNRELWVDAVYMQCPFYARCGVHEDEAGYDEAIDQIRIHTRYLQEDRTGLFRHSWRESPDMYPSSTYWSRGNGWALAGIVDTLALLPDDREERQDLLDILETVAESVLELQDDSGYWHHILDDDESSLETSGTLMFAYAFSKAVDLGYLDSESYVEAAQRAFDVCKGLVTEDGDVTRVAKPPGGEKMPLGVTSYGQGWFLLAASQLGDGD